MILRQIIWNLNGTQSYWNKELEDCQKKLHDKDKGKIPESSKSLI